MASPGSDVRRRYVAFVATREELHRKVDALSESQLERARLVVLNEVDEETSVEAILARHGERRLSSEEFEEHFADLPRDGEGLSPTDERGGAGLPGCLR